MDTQRNHLAELCEQVAKGDITIRELLLKGPQYSSNHVDALVKDVLNFIEEDFWVRGPRPYDIVVAAMRRLAHVLRHGDEVDLDRVIDEFEVMYE
ncbi:MAG: hypothetical protein HS102_02465 [Planctomycetia bacterium]|nr:hypothetical protein [Planctomycetia bacterium]